MGFDPLAKDKVLDLSLPRERLLITQYCGNKIIKASSLTYPHSNRVIRGVANYQFIAKHLKLFRARSVSAAAARPSDDLPKRTPAKTTVKGADFLNQFNQCIAAIFEEFVVGYDQAGLPKEKVEGKVLQAVKRVPARENRKVAVSHDSNVPDVPDPRPSILGVHRDYLGIDCREKAVALENFGTCGGERALREDHYGIVLDSRPHLMICHSGTSQLGFSMQDLGRSRPKFPRSVVTAMN